MTEQTEKKNIVEDQAPVLNGTPNTFAALLNLIIQAMNKFELDVKALYANADIFDKRLKLFEDRLDFLAQK